MTRFFGMFDSLLTSYKYMWPDPTKWVGSRNGRNWENLA